MKTIAEWLKFLRNGVCYSQKEVGQIIMVGKSVLRQRHLQNLHLAKVQKVKLGKLLLTIKHKA
jgi:hypothetical protein